MQRAASGVSRTGSGVPSRRPSASPVPTDPQRAGMDAPSRLGVFPLSLGVDAAPPPPLEPLPLAASLRQFAYEVQRIGTVLAPQADKQRAAATWEKRVGALRQLATIADADCSAHPDFVSLCYAHVRLPLRAQLEDLRSQVEREACATVARFVCHGCSAPGTAEALSEWFAAPLLTLTGATVSAMASAAASALFSICRYGRVNRTFVAAVAAACAGKNGAVRRHAMEALVWLMRCADPALVLRHAVAVKAALRAGLSDAVPAVRVRARVACWALDAVSHSEATSLVDGCEMGVKRALKDEHETYTRWMALPLGDDLLDPAPSIDSCMSVTVEPTGASAASTLRAMSAEDGAADGAASTAASSGYGASASMAGAAVHHRQPLRSGSPRGAKVSTIMGNGPPPTGSFAASRSIAKSFSTTPAMPAAEPVLAAARHADPAHGATAATGPIVATMTPSGFRVYGPAATIVAGSRGGPAAAVAAAGHATPQGGSIRKSGAGSQGRPAGAEVLSTSPSKLHAAQGSPSGAASVTLGVERRLLVHAVHPAAQVVVAPPRASPGLHTNLPPVSPARNPAAAVAADAALVKTPSRRVQEPELTLSELRRRQLTAKADAAFNAPPSEALFGDATASFPAGSSTSVHASPGSRSILTRSEYDVLRATFARVAGLATSEKWQDRVQAAADIVTFLEAVARTAESVAATAHAGGEGGATTSADSAAGGIEPTAGDREDPSSFAALSAASAVQREQFVAVLDAARVKPEELLRVVLALLGDTHAKVCLAAFAALDSFTDRAGGVASKYLDSILLPLFLKLSDPKARARANQSLRQYRLRFQQGTLLHHTTRLLDNVQHKVRLATLEFLYHLLPLCDVVLRAEGAMSAVATKLLSILKRSPPHDVSRVATACLCVLHQRHRDGFAAHMAAALGGRAHQDIAEQLQTALPRLMDDMRASAAGIAPGSACLGVNGGGAQPLGAHGLVTTGLFVMDAAHPDAVSAAARQTLTERGIPAAATRALRAFDRPTPEELTAPIVNARLGPRQDSAPHGYSHPDAASAGDFGSDRTAAMFAVGSHSSHSVAAPPLRTMTAVPTAESCTDAATVASSLRLAPPSGRSGTMAFRSGSTYDAVMQHQASSGRSAQSTARTHATADLVTLSGRRRESSPLQQPTPEAPALFFSSDSGVHFASSATGAAVPVAAPCVNAGGLQVRTAEGKRSGSASSRAGLGHSWFNHSTTFVQSSTSRTQSPRRSPTPPPPARALHTGNFPEPPRRDAAPPPDATIAALLSNAQLMGARGAIAAPTATATAAAMLRPEEPAAVTALRLARSMDEKLDALAALETAELTLWLDYADRLAPPLAALSGDSADRRVRAAALARLRQVVATPTLAMRHATGTFDMALSAIASALGDDALEVQGEAKAALKSAMTAPPARFCLPPLLRLTAALDARTRPSEDATGAPQTDSDAVDAMADSVPALTAFVGWIAPVVLRAACTGGTAGPMLADACSALVAVLGHPRTDVRRVAVLALAELVVTYPDEVALLTQLAPLGVGQLNLLDTYAKRHNADGDLAGTRVLPEGGLLARMRELGIRS